MLFSGKENIFMCLIAFQKMFQKIFYDVWLCFWKYHRKHIFYLLLTFSHIFLVAKRIYNIIYSSIQKHKQNPEKKNHQIRSNWEKKEEREATAFDEGLRSARCFARLRSARCFVRSQSARRRDRDWHEGEIAIGAKARSRSARCFARSRSTLRAIAISVVLREITIGANVRSRSMVRSFSLCASVSRSFSLSLSPFARLWALFFARLSFGSDLKVK